MTGHLITNQSSDPILLVLYRLGAADNRRGNLLTSGGPRTPAGVAFRPSRIALEGRSPGRLPWLWRHRFFFAKKKKGIGLLGGGGKYANELIFFKGIGSLGRICKWVDLELPFLFFLIIHWKKKRKSPPAKKKRTKHKEIVDRYDADDVDVDDVGTGAGKMI